ncbi:hypothetical protein SLEP1_g59695, partial [Rubroshorea leprosula]
AGAIRKDPGRVPSSYVPDIEDAQNPVHEIKRKGEDKEKIDRRSAEEKIGGRSADEEIGGRSTDEEIGGDRQKRRSADDRRREDDENSTRPVVAGRTSSAGVTGRSRHRSQGGFDEPSKAGFQPNPAAGFVETQQLGFICWVPMNPAFHRPRVGKKERERKKGRRGIGRVRKAGFRLLGSSLHRPRVGKKEIERKKEGEEEGSGG